MRLIILFLLSILLRTTEAWWDGGHLLVARIAQTELFNKDRAKYFKAVKMLSYLQDRMPNLTWREKTHAFVGSATFGDFFKYKGGMYQKNWHFTNIPYTEGKPSGKPKFKKDIVTSLSGLQKIVKGQKGYQTTYEYKEIMSGLSKVRGGALTKNQLAQSIALRLIIHYVGDIHQPLHDVSRFSKQGRQDYGGNGVKLPKKLGADNLHAVWDSVVYTKSDQFKLPLSDASWKELTAYSTAFRSKYKTTAAKANDLNPQNWAMESYDISKQTVYPSVKRYQQLSASYVKKAVPIAERQIVLGGQRLANLLASIL